MVNAREIYSKAEIVILNIFAYAVFGVSLSR